LKGKGKILKRILTSSFVPEEEERFGKGMEIKNRS